MPQRHILILTDLDGSLLDATTYSYDAAADALSAIQTTGATLKAFLDAVNDFFAEQTLRPEQQEDEGQHIG